jgi:RNA polymerase sigma-70 factor (ECF subfamily)
MKDFKRIVNQQRHRVYTYASYMLCNQEEAEDATQEVLVRLWRHWGELDEKTVAAWLIRVARNACIDRLRSRRARNLRVAAGGGDGTIEGVSMAPAPDEIVEARELRDQIQLALTRIDEPYRSLIIMREIQDMTYNEISESMDLPLNTVKSYIHRGRRALRDALKEIVNFDRV